MAEMGFGVATISKNQASGPKTTLFWPFWVQIGVVLVHYRLFFFLKLKEQLKTTSFWITHPKQHCFGLFKKKNIYETKT